MTNPLADMDKPDVIFCIGTNMTECHPVAATRVKRALARGAKLIVADPRRIPLADLADLYLPLRVGSDVALLLGMAHVIAREKLVDEAFIHDRTVDGEAFLEHVEEYPPEWAERITEVPAKQIEEAAILYGKACRGAIYYTLGITEHICGVDNVQSLCNLALMTGNVGREGTGINPMRGQNNIQGAGDAGALPDHYPGFQRVTEPANQARFKALYGNEVDLEKGITKVTALDLCGDRIRAMLIDGENTLLSDPDREHCEHALRSLDHLVVIDTFLTDTARLADVVLPATAWGETDGVCTNTERRVQRLRAAVPPPGQARPDWWIVSGIARRLGLDGFEFTSPMEVFNELCGLSPIYRGLDWDRIERGEYHWPVPEAGHAGTPILHQGRFVNGRGIFTRPSIPRPGGDGERGVSGLDDDRTPAPVLSYAYSDGSLRGDRLSVVRGVARGASGRPRGLGTGGRGVVHGVERARFDPDQGQVDRAVSPGHGVRQLQLQRRARQRADGLWLRSDHADG